MFVSLNLLVSVFISMTSLKTGILSAIIAAFIIEFYPKLSPDSSSQTALLAQISQQLADFPTGNHSIVTIRPPPPSASMVWVIAIWLISSEQAKTSRTRPPVLVPWYGHLQNVRSGRNSSGSEWQGFSYPQGFG